MNDPMQPKYPPPLGGPGMQLRGGIAVGGRRVGEPSELEAWNYQYQRSQVDFDRDEFTRVLAGHGMTVLWQSALPCPNVRGESLPQDHDFTCTVCDGTGFLYFNPITGDVDEGHKTKMLLTDAKLSHQFYPAGFLMPGDAMVTALPECRINYWDRLTLPEAIGTHTERVRRQPGTVVDRFKYTPISINTIIWIDRHGKRRMARRDVEVEPTEYGIRWITDDRPVDRAYYSVSYVYRPRYIIQDLPHFFNQHPVGEDMSKTGKAAVTEFPITAMARLDLYVRDQSRDPPKTVDASPFPPEE